ncbi:MAG: hypothetical protein ACT4P7_15890 [Gemmatimonadaceae bacterium]
MASIRRVVAVTGGLIATGLVAGGIAAACGLAITAMLRGNWRFALDAEVWLFSGAIGAAIGGVVAPLTSWLFLRHVPLGALVIQTTLATAVAGGLGLALHINPLIAAPLGYVAAATRLAIVNRSRRTSATLPGAEGDSAGQPDGTATLRGSDEARRLGREP